MRPSVRASERPGVRAVVSDNFGGGGRALRSGFPTNWIPVGGGDPRDVFHPMGRAFFVTNLTRLSLCVLGGCTETHFVSGGTTPGAGGAGGQTCGTGPVHGG